MFEQMVRQKMENGWHARLAAVPALTHSVLFYSILFYSILFYSILFYSILFYFILFYSILFYYILFCSVLQLLKFQKNIKNENNPQAGYPLSNQPDLKMHFKYSEKTVRHGPTKHYSHPRTDISYVGSSYYSVLVYMFPSSQDVLIVYVCFQDNTSAVLLRS
jgi:hypothetical protein